MWLLVFAGGFLTINYAMAEEFLEDPLEGLVQRWLMVAVALMVAMGLSMWMVTWVPRARSASALWRQLRLEDGSLLRIYSRSETPRIEPIESMDARLRRAEGQADLAVCAEGRLIATLEERILSVFSVSSSAGQGSLLGDRVLLHDSVPADCVLLGLRRDGYDNVVIIMSGGSRTASMSLSDVSKPWDDWAQLSGPSRSAAFLGPSLLWVDHRGGLFPRDAVPRVVREAVQSQEVLAIDSAVIGVTAYLLVHLRSDSGVATYIVNSKSGDIIGFFESEEAPQTVNIMRESGWGASTVTVLSAYGRAVTEHTVPAGTTR